ncbi:MAG: hypothetical protein MK183_07285 [Verrucomicrobiales bacterium]|nr:hypothetical protein [Verrucomicrobiales bacterium]
MTGGIRWARFNAPLRFQFKHASANRTKSSSIIVEASSGSFRGYGEACPRPYVTGETERSVIAFLRDYGEDWISSIRSIESLRARLQDEKDLIDRNPAAFAALEIALLDLLAQEQGLSVETLIGLPALSGKIQYSAIVGDSSPLKTRAQALVYRLAGFRDFKVKIGADINRDKRRFRSLPRNIRLRVDVNNLYDTAARCVNHLKALDREIWAIEEPLEAGDVEGQAQLAKEMKARVILDESLCRKAQLPRYKESALEWIANVRVSKSGGILRAIDLARAAQELGMDVILGAHVGETSLLSRAALSVGQALERPPLAREGAFGRILVTRDVSDPSLRFGAGGVLRTGRWNFAQRPGLGLFMQPEALFGDQLS